jgi:phosphinothricin acetyltransferase
MIRSALSVDATEITALWNAMIRETDVTFTTELKLRGDIEAMIADPARCVHVAEHKGAFAGFALLGSFRGGPGYAQTVEHTVYVMPNAKGLGLGRTLIDALCAFAVAQNHHVMVGAISGGNIEAVGFHKALGFSKVAVMPQVGRKNGIWHDLILMQKILETSADTSEGKR